MLVPLEAALERNYENGHLSRLIEHGGTSKPTREGPVSAGPGLGG